MHRHARWDDCRIRDPGGWDPGGWDPGGMRFRSRVMLCEWKNLLLTSSLSSKSWVMSSESWVVSSESWVMSSESWVVGRES